jgi:hypothetical protein
MQEFNNLPPYMYLKQVLMHCPRAGETYIELWRAKDKQSKVRMDPYESEIKFMIKSRRFKTDLFQLVKEGLVSVTEHLNRYEIELVDYGEE